MKPESNLTFDLKKIERDRIAKQCVCCGGVELKKSPAVLMPFVAHRVFGWQPVQIDESWGLSTIKNGNAYAICNSLGCENCGFVFLDIRFSESEMGALYNDYRGEEYVQLRDFYEPGYRERNQYLNQTINYLEQTEAFLAPHVKFPLNILDWGGDTGKNTPFKDKCNTLSIFDISNKSVIDGALKVDLETIRSHRYELIVSCNVLEHVPYPADLILEMKAAMHRDTVLFIEVPYENLMKLAQQEHYLLKKHWHEHINFYSKDALLKLVNNCGLSVVAMRDLEVTVGKTPGSVFQLACKLD